MNAAQARLRFIQARHEVHRLDRELSGCDWCCGGGSERRRRAVAQRDEASAFLTGADAPMPPPLCRDCRYHDGTIPFRRLGLHLGFYCDRCATLRGIPTTES